VTGISRRTAAVLLGLLAAGFVFLALADPVRPLPGVHCGMKALLGIPCPLCGMTRALSSLVRGHLAAGIAFHPLSPLFLAGGMVLAAALLADAAGSRRFGTRSLGDPIHVVAGASLLLGACWIAGIALR
jgi:hypothetical protein